VVECREKEIQAKNAELKKLKDKAKQYILKTKSDLKQKDANIKRLEAAMRELQQASRSTTKELQQAKSRLSTLEDGHQAKLKSVMEEHKKEILSNQQNMQKEREELETQRKQWAQQREISHSSDLDTLMENNKLLKGKFIEAEQLHKDSEEKCKELSKSIEEITTQFSEYKTKVATKIQRANQDARALKQKNQEMEDTKHKLEWAQRRVIDLQKQLTRNPYRDSLLTPTKAGSDSFEALKIEMEKEELKAKHAAEMSKMQAKYEARIKGLETSLKGEIKKTIESEEGGDIDDKPLEDQVKYWKEQKALVDVELSSMQQALESMREQVENTRELSVENLRLKQQSADSTRAKLESQREAMRLHKEVNDAKRQLEALNEQKDAQETAQNVEIKKLSQKVLKLQSHSVDKLKADLAAKHKKELKSLEQSYKDHILKAEAKAKKATAQAESDRKKRNYAKTEFLKVFNELEGLRKKVGDMRVKSDLRTKRYRAEISDLQNLLGIDGDDGLSGEKLPGMDLTPTGNKESKRGSQAELFDVELVEISDSLADITYQEIESKASSIQNMIEDYLSICKNVFDNENDRKGANDNKRVEDLGGDIQAEINNLLSLLLDVASHQKKCQIALTNLGADGANMEQGCGAGLKIICNAMFGAFGNAPSGVKRRDRRGDYRYSMVNS